MNERQKRKLQALPQAEHEVWQGADVALRVWITPPKGPPSRPHLILWVNATADKILAQEPKETGGSPQVVLEGLVQAMQRPAWGRPHRPGVVRVRDPELARFLERELDGLGIECECWEILEPLDNIVAMLEASLTGPEGPVPGYLDTPGVTPDQVARLFEAAAAFYRAAPWERLSDRFPIAVKSERFGEEPWYVAILGQAGILRGLSFTRSLELFEEMHRGRFSERKAAQKLQGLSLSFGNITEMSFDDLDAIEIYGWEVAGPEAYPFAYRVDPGAKMRRPQPQELELMEACLRAIPDFVRDQVAAFPGLVRQVVDHQVTVPTSGGDVTLSLTCPIPGFLEEGPAPWSRTRDTLRRRRRRRK